MTFRRGALHDPSHPGLSSAIDFAAVRVGTPAPVNWFASCPADGDILDNDRLSDCVPVADFRLLQIWMALQGTAWPIPLDLVHLRYAATGGWDGTPATDTGTVTQADMFAWQAGPIVAADREWRVKWLTVAPADVLAALRCGPLLVTLGLTAEDADDPDTWWDDPAGPFIEFHRVVAGYGTNDPSGVPGRLICRTYGRDVLVALSRVVAADLLVHVDAPEALRTAGIAWSSVV